MPQVMGYTKLFAEIVASTIWREDDKTRIVWITMLAMKNERHMVEASVPGLADLARVSLPQCEAALEKLAAPDKYSRNQQFEGRRIEKRDGGWFILNGEHYRKKMDLEERRAYQREYQRNYRKGIKKGKPLPGEDNYVRGVEDGTIDPETELPSRNSALPANEEQAKEWCAVCGVPPEFAVELFHQCEGRGWVDGAGQHVKNWASYARQRWTKRQGEMVEKRTKPNTSSHSIMDIKTVIQTKENLAADLKNRHALETGLDTTWDDPKAKSQYSALRKEIKSLQQQLGGMA